MDKPITDRPIRRRITILKIPIDIVENDYLDDVILDILKTDSPKQIILLSIWDLLRARRNAEYRTMVNGAALVLPTSKSIIRGASFLKKPRPVRYNHFSFIIDLLSVLEKYHKSLYLFGGRKKSLLKAEKNVRQTFPGLSVVGRYVGFYPKQFERDIITAIQKAAPSLVVVANGVPGKERWIYRNRRQFSQSMFLWYRDVIDIFAERQKRPSDGLFKAGLEFIPSVIKNPLKIFYIFRYLLYNILLLAYRVFKIDRG